MKKQTFQSVAAMPAPWVSAEVTPADLHAIQQLVRGQATEGQQLLIVEWIRRASGLGELEFRPEGDRASAFASGKRWVGMQFFTNALTTLVRAEKAP